MKRIAITFAVLVALAPALTEAQQLPYTLPSNTVVGRLANTGPAQAIPFATLSSNLLANPLTGLTINPLPGSGAQGLLINQTPSGSVFPAFAGGSGTSGTAENGIYIPTDTGAVGGGFLYDFNITHLFGGSAVTGGRTSYLGWLVQTAATNASNAQRNYPTGVFISDTRSGDGGTNTGAGALGSYFGVNGVARVGPSATNVSVATGAEFDNLGSTGGSVKYNWGVNIANFTTLTGASSDAGLIFYNGGSNTSAGITYGPGGGWQQGISFAEIASSGTSPIAAAGTMIGTHLETLANFTIANGIDLRKISFSGNVLQASAIGAGNFLRFRNSTDTGTLFNVDSSGNVTTAGTVTINGTAAAVTTYVGFIRIALTGVNFNVGNTDTPVTVTLPAGISRYQVQSVRLGNASASLSTATVGVFTGTGGTGQTIAATQAITVTATAADSNNNAQNLTLTNANTEAYNDATLQVRVSNPQGSAATGDVVFTLVPQT